MCMPLNLKYGNAEMIFQYFQALQSALKEKRKEKKVVVLNWYDMTTHLKFSRFKLQLYHNDSNKFLEICNNSLYLQILVVFYIMPSVI